MATMIIVFVQSTKIASNMDIKADIFDVISESQDLRGQTYNYDNNNLKWDYFYKNKELLELRLLQGGVRLAGMLNRCFVKN